MADGDGDLDVVVLKCADDASPCLAASAIVVIPNLQAPLCDLDADCTAPCVGDAAFTLDVAVRCEEGWGA